MKRRGVCFGVALVASVCAGQGTNFEVTATGDKVNLRCRPDSGTEVVMQASEGQTLKVVRLEGEWMGVEAPSNAPAWMKGQYIKKGLVAGDKVKLRAGPGISYRDVGQVKRDDPVKECETHGEWVRIAPPRDMVLWVSRSMVAVVVPPEPPPVVHALPDSRPEPVEPVPADLTLPRELPAGLSKDQLQQGRAQGHVVERTGTVERLPLAFVRHIQYRLVDVREGRREMICFLQGNDRQMPTLVGRRLTVKGREYWLEKQHYAVLYPELITPILE